MHSIAGNLTSDPTTGKAYTYYPSNNQLWTVSSPWTALSYDAFDRLATIDSTTDTNFAYDGLAMIAEYDAANALQRRFVHGPGMDEPLVQYEGAGTNNRRFLEADERGSVILIADSSGATLTTNRYDEFGKPQSSNSGRFQYTGQQWLPEAGLYHYKNRAYAAHLGRFMQTDPIGYEGGTNLYAYVGNDPINLFDPLGLQACGGDVDACVTAPDPWLSELQIWQTLGHLYNVEDREYNRGDSFFSFAALAPAQCPAVPRPGPGKGVLNGNIRDALLDAKVNSMDPFSITIGGLNLSNVTNFASLVAPYARYDYKVHITGAAEFGNFNYGAVGGAYGFSLKTLLDRASNVQTVWDAFTFRGFRLSDNIDDPKPIAAGFRYFSVGCYK